MSFALRPYSGEDDIRQMLRVSRTSAPNNLHVLDMPYRLSSWALDYPENVGLWVDATGQLVAWAVLLTPMWVIDYVYLPALDTAIIHQTILSWADTQAHQILHQPNGHPAWFVNVREDWHDRRAALEAAGFACQMGEGWQKAFLSRSAQTPIPSHLVPGGLTLRPLAGQSEVEAYVALHRAAFGSENMTVAWRNRVLESAEYRPDLDLVAVADDGRLAAFCVGWFGTDEAGQRAVGQIEPMGVHPDFQHQGLGQAILGETLRRLYALGAEEVLVESDVTDDGAFPFYQSQGFQVAHNVLVYRKEYD